MTRQPAVVLISSGSPGQLRAAVDGFYAHYAGADVALIIVRNGFLEPARDLLDTVRQRGAQLILNDGEQGFSRAANQGAALARPDADLVLLRHEAVLEAGAIEFLQEACYDFPGTALSVPQYVLPSGHPDTWMHAPYAQEALPCDITLSLHHGNVEQVGVFHDGERVELNFATFDCAYIKREVWNRCGGLEDGEPHADLIMCEYVRSVLGLKIIYTPAAIVRDVMSGKTQPGWR